MSDLDYRFFLAHDRGESDERVDQWRETLTEVLGEAYPDHAITIVAGRDDYRSRASDAGGWKGWPQTVVSGRLWDGSPRFHGVIRPAQYVGVMDTVCGRATFDMIEGFIREGKIAWVWDTRTGEYHKVRGVVRLPGDDYKAWGRLVVREEGAAQ